MTKRKITVDFTEAQRPLNLMIIAVAVAEGIKQKGVKNDRKRKVQ